MSQQLSDQSSTRRNIWLNIIGWITIGVIPTLSFLLFLCSTLSHQQPVTSVKQFQTVGDGSLSKMTKSELDEEKVRQEILKIDSDRQQQYLTQLTSYGSFITALVAVIGVVITIWKTSTDNTTQKARDRQQRETESQRQLNEQFAIAMRDLGSDQLSIKAGAAIALRSFLRPECHILHDQVYQVILANLKLKHNDEINHLLIQAFEIALPLQLNRAKAENRKFEVSLVGANLERANLSGLDLSQTDLSKPTRDSPSQLDMARANLQGANLTGTKLERSRGFRVNLQKARLSNANLSEARLQYANLDQAFCHSTILVSADLKHANLKNTQFQQAHFQSAHLEKADLRGAKFEQADVADTFFHKAKFNVNAHTALRRAYNSQKANLKPRKRSKTP